MGYLVRRALLLCIAVTAILLCVFVVFYIRKRDTNSILETNVCACSVDCVGIEEKLKGDIRKVREQLDSSAGGCGEGTAQLGNACKKSCPLIMQTSPQGGAIAIITIGSLAVLGGTFAFFWRDDPRLVAAQTRLRAASVPVRRHGTQLWDRLASISDQR